VCFAKKALPNVDHCFLLQELFPKAKFICLYRHPMDFVWSALDACRLGFASYGLLPYATGHVNNFVLAMTRAWCEKVSIMLDLQRQLPDRCFAVRYEKLVTSPQTVFSDVCSYIGVRQENTAHKTAFQTPHLAGYGDHKIHSLSSVSTDSVGRGVVIPTRLIPPAGIAHLNELMEGCGYEEISYTWNQEWTGLRVGLMAPDAELEVCSAIEEALREGLTSRRPRGWESIRRLGVRIEEFECHQGWLLDLGAKSLEVLEVSSADVPVVFARAKALCTLMYGFGGLSDLHAAGELRLSGVQNIEALRALSILESLIAEPVGVMRYLQGGPGDRFDADEEDVLLAVDTNSY
jgi:hypothetical protein